MATLLQIPEGTIKSRLFRARRALRRELDDTGAVR
jgi:DNA-directed RNA polymerase specialized sigma24 family protein